MGGDYEKKTVAQLHDLLKARGLPTSGRKNELVARLQEADNAAKSAAGGADDVIDWDDEAPAAAAADEPVNPSTEAGAAAIAAGGKGEVPNPVAVPNQELGIDPAKTDDLKVESVGDAPAKAAEAEAAAKENEETEERPAVDYTMGLQATELEEELKKRKRRAEKFGIVEDTETAVAEAEKALQRAKRFGAGDAPSGPGVNRLDQALPTERPPRKRGRGDEQDGRGGKRRNFDAGRNRNGRPNNRIRNGGGGDGGGGDGNRKPALSEKDAAAAEARKKRFATAA